MAIIRTSSHGHGEKDTEGDRETKRQKTKRQIDRNTETQIIRKAVRQRNRKTETQGSRKTEK